MLTSPYVCTSTRCWRKRDFAPASHGFHSIWVDELLRGGAAASVGMRSVLKKHGTKGWCPAPSIFQSLRTRSVSPSALALVIALAISICAASAAAADSIGLYREGQLVDVLDVEASGADAPIAAGSALSSEGGSFGGLVPRAPTKDTRERNAIFARAARRAVSVRKVLERMVVPRRSRHPMYLKRLRRLFGRFLVVEEDMREGLDKVGRRVQELQLDPTIQRRQHDTIKQFEAGCEELREAIDAVLAGDADAIPRVLELMDRLRFRNDPPLLSSALPYDVDVRQAPIVSADAPDDLEASDSAQLSGQSAGAPLSPSPPTAADLMETIDVQLTPEIAAKAAALGNSPVAMYEFVRNTVGFQPYLGSRKGAAETLRQLRGNDTDQASLLLALLRVSGIPSRYVRGTVELEPARAMSWLGVDDAATAASILTTAGLDGVAVVNGPVVVAVRFTHVWVEAYVPYSNYRGVPNDSAGKIWVPLDPSFKGSTVTPGMDVLTPMGLDIDAYLADYISTFHTPSPLEKLEQDVQAYLDANDPGKTVGDIERTTEIGSQNLGILPGSLPYRVSSVSAQLAELEDTKRYKVRFHLYDGSTTFIDYTANLAAIIGKRVTIQYVGATPTDQATIDSFGGIYETPPNLVDVKPILKLDNVPVATSVNSIGMGLSHSSDMQFIQPVGASNVQPLVQNSIIAGNGQAIGLDTFLDVDDTLIDDQPFPPDVFLESMLHGTALDYLSRVDRGHEQAGRLMGVVTTEDVSEAIVANSIAVSFSFGTPVTFEWTGLTVDADRRIIGPFAANGDASKARPYMILTGMDASTMENRVFEDRFAQRAISTIKILELASDAAIPICTVTTTIGGNCPGTTQPAFVQNAVNAAAAAGHIVTIPKHPITVGMWSGTGYIDMEPGTGAAGYIISGGISGGVRNTAGGATVDTWPIDLTCRAVGVMAEVVDPPRDAPDPSAVFCASDSPITFEVEITVTCLNADGSTTIQPPQTQFLTTSKTVRELPGGDYDVKLVAIGTTTIRKIRIGEEFRISYSTFIPPNYVNGPPSAFCVTPPPFPTLQFLVFKGDDRGFDRASNDYRTNYFFTVIPQEECNASGIKGSITPDTGTTKSYAEDAVLADGMLDAGDDDGVAGDCHLFEESGKAGLGNMKSDPQRIDRDTVHVRLFGGAGNPLTPSPEISWDVTIAIDGKNRQWSLQGQHDCYPAHEMYVNDMRMHRHFPKSNSIILAITPCLSGLAQVSTGEMGNLPSP